MYVAGSVKLNLIWMKLNSRKSGRTFRFHQGRRPGSWIGRRSAMGNLYHERKNGNLPIARSDHAFDFPLRTYLNRTSSVWQSTFTFNLLVLVPLLQLPIAVVTGGAENGDALNSACRRSMIEISISVVQGASEKLLAEREGKIQFAAFGFQLIKSVASITWFPFWVFRDVCHPTLEGCALFVLC